MSDPRLRQKLDTGEFIAAPGIQDMITALVANDLEVEVVYGSGYWLTASTYGLPDAGLATYTEMLDCMSRLAEVSNAAVIADADTGYGDLLNVERTIRGYEAAGISGIQLEDQEIPKKCSHSMQIRCIPMSQMAKKIEVACESRRDKKNTLIIARTDARRIETFSQTLKRAESYAKAGADILFIESYQSETEMTKACKELDLPLMANMNDGGNAPLFSAEELSQMGFRIGIWPSLLPLAAIHTLRNALSTFLKTGDSKNSDIRLASFSEFSDLIGFDKIREFNRRWGENPIISESLD
ncbi:MAG: isocitrate lyase/PEP mutase family protein [Woeseiaceae bacterium]|nr:isocitrate lyase/PEP mutase family protein [Woeseiaceae bacterium]